jgi:predicted nucleic acid-binding protein
MRIIIDNNILFSLMKPNSTNSKIFSIVKFEYIAPKFIIKEFNKHKAEYLKKSGLSEREFILLN